MRIVCFVLFTVFSSVLNAQVKCYDETRSRGISLYNSRQYQKAKKAFETAKACPDKPSNNDLESWIKKCERPTKQEPQRNKGNLDLGYAKWKGDIKNGKPSGKGTMTFVNSHRIDMRDPKGRVAETGDRIEGIYIDGHLDEGRWYKSDGTTEYLMLGE